MVATLARRFGDLDIAEESAAEAFTTAVVRWQADGVPPNPGAWLTTTANRKAIDRIRRESQARRQVHGSSDVVRGRGPIRAARQRHGRRRAAPTDLHLLSPGALDPDPRRADAAYVRRTDSARDCPRVPGARERHGSADHPRQGQNQNGAHPLSDTGRGGSPSDASRAYSLFSTSSSTRVIGRAGPRATTISVCRRPPTSTTSSTDT